MKEPKYRFDDLWKMDGFVSVGYVETSLNFIVLSL